MRAFLLFSSAFLLLVSGLRSNEVRLSVSDLMAQFVAPALDSFGESNDIQFDIDSIGSLPAMDRLRADEIDAAIIAVPEDEEVPRDEFKVYPFAYDIAVVAVNETHPLNEISMDRLGGIFGASEELNFNSWGELGLSGWGNRSIKALAAQNEDSISLELFKNEVLRSKTLKPAVAVVKDSEVEGLLTSDAGSIAVMPNMPKSRKLKTLMISESAGAPAFGPTDDNVHFGDYPVRLAFYIIYNERDEAQLKDVFRALFGDEVAEALKENGFYALPDTVRRKLLIDLELER